MGFNELAKKLGLDEEEYLELVELFIETEIEELDNLKSAIEKKKTEEILKLAHSIKGASGNLGFMELHATAKDIENSVKDGNDDALLERIKYLHKKLVEIARLAGMNI